LIILVKTRIHATQLQTGIALNLALEERGIGSLQQNSLQQNRKGSLQQKFTSAKVHFSKKSRFRLQ
jgi:hypothetical protein